MIQPRLLYYSVFILRIFFTCYGPRLTQHYTSLYIPEMLVNVGYCWRDGEGEAGSPERVSSALTQAVIPDGLTEVACLGGSELALDLATAPRSPVPFNNSIHPITSLPQSLVYPHSRHCG